MNEFYCIDHIYSETLGAKKLRYDVKIGIEVVRCPVNKEHGNFAQGTLDRYRNARVNAQVRHNNREEKLIWVSAGELLVHDSIADEMQSRGFTGYSLAAATVRFRDGVLSHDYRRLDIIGWGGLARPASGIHLLQECPGCPIKTYSELKDPSQLIDQNQWMGDDFFLVWPMPYRRFITRRVVEYFESAKVRTYHLVPLEKPTGGAVPLNVKGGFYTKALTEYLPEDLANKYGKRLDDRLAVQADAVLLSQASANYISGGGAKDSDLPQERDCQEKLTAVRELIRRWVLNPAGLADLKPYSETIFELCDQVFATVTPPEHETFEVEWVMNPEHRRTTREAENLLLLLGYLPGEEAGRRLRGALQLTDPYLRMLAVGSLLRRNDPVAPEHIEAVAASRIFRIYFWGDLQDQGKESIMPVQWAAPEELAASDLSVWLTLGDRLNAIPEEVELMKTIPVKDKAGNSLERYLFRFREYPKPWEPGEGWMAGIAGPFRDGKKFDEPDSALRRWDEMSPEEHWDMLRPEPDRIYEAPVRIETPLERVRIAERAKS